MKQLCQQRWLIGSAALVAVAALGASAHGQYDNCSSGGSHYAIGSCCSVFGPIRRSPLDMPLRPYYIPRTLAWGPHDYRYAVKETVPFCGCDQNGPCGDGACLAGGYPYPPEAAAAFEPCEFENLGEIPNDSLLGGIATPSAR